MEKVKNEVFAGVDHDKLFGYQAFALSKASRLDDFDHVATYHGVAKDVIQLSGLVCKLVKNEQQEFFEQDINTVVRILSIFGETGKVLGLLKKLMFQGHEWEKSEERMRGYLMDMWDQIHLLFDWFDMRLDDNSYLASNPHTTRQLLVIRNLAMRVTTQLRFGVTAIQISCVERASGQSCTGVSNSVLYKRWAESLAPSLIPNINERVSLLDDEFGKVLRLLARLAEVTDPDEIRKLYPLYQTNQYWFWLWGVIGVIDEASELSDLALSILRDDDPVETLKWNQAWVFEMGDVFWYLAVACFGIQYPFPKLFGFLPDYYLSIIPQWRNLEESTLSVTFFQKTAVTLCELAEIADVDLLAIFNGNRNKLDNRYKDGFSAEASQSRYE